MRGLVKKLDYKKLVHKSLVVKTQLQRFGYEGL